MWDMYGSMSGLLGNFDSIGIDVANLQLASVIDQSRHVQLAHMDHELT